MKKTLLLDYDGVVLRNTYLSQYQLNRSAKFVQKHSHLSYQTCKEINSKYYPKHGHTVTLINKMFNKNVTLEEYNDYVFSLRHLKKLNHLVDAQTYEHGNAFNKLFEFCQANNMQWHTYTNAHINWVLNFSNLLDLPMISAKNIIWPLDISLLKPNKVSYDIIEKELCDYGSSFTMVDDSLLNLTIPRERPNKWMPIHFKENHKVDDILCELHCW